MACTALVGFPSVSCFSEVSTQQVVVEPLPRAARVALPWAVTQNSPAGRTTIAPATPPISILEAVYEAHRDQSARYLRCTNWRGAFVWPERSSLCFVEDGFNFTRQHG